MSAFMDEIHKLLDEAKAEFAKLFGHGDAEVQAVAKAAVEKIDAVKTAVEADAPKIEAEAATDAETVAHDTEAAAKPVVEEAVHDGETVAAEAAADVAKDA